MTKYRLRILENGGYPTVEFHSTSDHDARGDARHLLSQLRRPGGAELWRVDELVRSLTRIGVIPYALRLPITPRSSSVVAMTGTL